MNFSSLSFHEEHSKGGEVEGGTWIHTVHPQSLIILYKFLSNRTYIRSSPQQPQPSQPDNNAISNSASFDIYDVTFRSQMPATTANWTSQRGITALKYLWICMWGFDLVNKEFKRVASNIWIEIPIIYARKWRERRSEAKTTQHSSLPPPLLNKFNYTLQWLAVNFAIASDYASENGTSPCAINDAEILHWKSVCSTIRF